MHGPYAIFRPSGQTAGGPTAPPDGQTVEATPPPPSVQRLQPAPYRYPVTDLAVMAGLGVAAGLVGGALTGAFYGGVAGLISCAFDRPKKPA